jgi:hypothetical protein
MQNARESLDGKNLFLCRANEPSAEPGLWVAPEKGGEWTRVADQCRPYGWSVLQDGIYLANRKGRSTRFLEFYSFETGQTTRVADLPDDAGGGVVSPDGKWLLFGKGIFTTTDITLVESFR